MKLNKYIISISIFGFIILEMTCSSTIPDKSHFTDMWAVYIPNATEDHVREIASRNGYTYIGVILKDYYQLQHRKVAKRSIYRNRIYNDNLSKEPEVRWLAQQVAKKRVKRGFRILHINFNDPKWPRMWYLNRGRGLDMNVQKAWRLGYTGKDVVVTILDDGIESDHPDLRRNYDHQASYDVNSHDHDPMPRYDHNNENRHGTRCAGEVAAAADNFVCSVGVAFNASIGGVRMLDGDVTDSVEAMSLGHKPQHVHIYSASWGPDDDGKTVDGPATLARKAFHDGVTKGRRGLGSIFVWASGNGGRRDNCNCDGYTNSIYTLSISSATENGNIPWYSEACSSTLATTYSSGSGGEKQIVTTDLRKSCTETHTGTSASAPLAAGLVALTLQANPMLTWRDLQHIVVMTAKPNNLHAPDWVTNGVHRKVSHSFGYGLMDAGRMVEHARNWTGVPEQHICEIRSPMHSRDIPMNGKITVPLYTDGCERTVHYVKYLEHVQARITLASSRRGEIQIFLTSPMKTRSTLLARRSEDISQEGFNNWAFMTTHCWGEFARGTWILEIENGASTFHHARLRDWVLVLYGTDRHPQQPAVATPKPSGVGNIRPSNRRKYRINRQPPYPYFTTPLPTTTTPKRFHQFYPSKTFLTNPYAHHRFHQRHECVFQTLAKKNNVSTTQYIRMIRANLSAAQLKGWNLVAMGTAAHPLLHNITPPAHAKEAFDCSAVSLFNNICISALIIVTIEQTVFSTRAHVFQIDPETKKSWIAVCQQAVDVSFYHDKARNSYRIVSVDGNRPLVNSVITHNMIFTKTSQKFGQWSDSRANTVYGLGFVSEADLAKFIEKFRDVKELTRQSISTIPVPGPEVNGTKEPVPVNKAVFHQRTNSLSSIQGEGGGLRERRNSYSNSANSNVTPTSNSSSNSLPNQNDAQLKYENDRLKLALAQSSANAKRWEVELQTLKNNNARLTAALQESTANVEEWKKQLALYKDENAKHRKRVVELESGTGTTDLGQTDEVKDLKKQLDALKEENKGKNDEIETLNVSLSKLSTHESANSSLKKQIQEVEQENVTLRQKVQNVEQLLKNAHNAKDRECQELLILQEQVGSKLTEMYELHENIVSTIKKESTS